MRQKSSRFLAPVVAALRGFGVPIVLIWLAVSFIAYGLAVCKYSSNLQPGAFLVFPGQNANGGYQGKVSQMNVLGGEAEVQLENLSQVFKLIPDAGGAKIAELAPLLAPGTEVGLRAGLDGTIRELRIYTPVIRDFLFHDSTNAADLRLKQSLLSKGWSHILGGLGLLLAAFFSRRLMNRFRKQPQAA